MLLNGPVPGAGFKVHWSNTRPPPDVAEVRLFAVMLVPSSFGAISRVQEVTRAGTKDEVNVAFNIRLKGKQRARNVKCVLVSIYLTAVQGSKLAALDRKTKGCNVLLCAIVVSEMDVVPKKVIVSCIHRGAISIASSIGLSINAMAKLDSDFILCIVVRRVRVALEDGGSRLADNKLFFINTGVNENGRIFFA